MVLNSSFLMSAMAAFATWACNLSVDATVATATKPYPHHGSSRHESHEFRTSHGKNQKQTESFTGDNKRVGLEMDQIILLDDDGSLTFRVPSYKLESKTNIEILTYNSKSIQSYGEEIVNKLQMIEDRARLVKQQHGNSAATINAFKETLNFAIKNGSGHNSLDSYHVEIFDFIVQDKMALVKACLDLIKPLVSLAKSHREEWISSKSSIQGQEDHYHRAVVANQVALQFYGHAWNIIDVDGMDASVYDKEEVAIGMSEIYLHLADLFQNRYVFEDHSEKSTLDEDRQHYYSMAHSCLLKAQHFARKSLSYLGVDANKSLHRNKQIQRELRHARDGKKKTAKHSIRAPQLDDHEISVQYAQQTLACSQVRMGMLLLEMYAAGYYFDTNGKLSLNGVSSSASSGLDSPYVPSSLEEQLANRLVINAMNEIEQGSLSFELAEALLNLAYAQSKLNQFHKSFKGFDGVLNHYSGRVNYGGTPWGHFSLNETPGHRRASFEATGELNDEEYTAWGMGNFLDRSRGHKIEERGLDASRKRNKETKISDSGSDEVIYGVSIDIDDFVPNENATFYGVI